MGRINVEDRLVNQFAGFIIHQQFIVRRARFVEDGYANK